MLNRKFSSNLGRLRGERAFFESAVTWHIIMSHAIGSSRESNPSRRICYPLNNLAHYAFATNEI